MSCFSLASFNIFSFVSQQVGYGINLGIYLFVFISLGFIALLRSADCFPSYLGSFQPLFFSNIFFCPFLCSGIPITHKLVHLILLPGSLRLCSFFSHSLFFTLDNFRCSICKFIVSFFCFLESDEFL